MKMSLILITSKRHHKNSNKKLEKQFQVTKKGEKPHTFSSCRPPNNCNFLFHSIAKMAI